MYAENNSKQLPKNQSEENRHSQKGNSQETSFQFQDNRPDVLVQRQLQETANKDQKAQKIVQLKKLAGEQVIGSRISFHKAVDSVDVETKQEPEPVNEAPVQFQLAQGSAYRVTQAEQGKHRTNTGNISPHARSVGFPSTQVGQVYLVVGFKNNFQYMELQPLTSGGENFFIPVGNDGFYDLEPELARDPNPGPQDILNDRNNTELLNVTGNPYNNQAPVATDITQGEIGNCWLIAPMMAMTMSAHWNQHIASLIQQQGQDYQVQLGNTENINTGIGAPTQMVTISGWIPTLDVGNGQMEFLYAQQQLGMPGKLVGGQGPVWPSLLEKAAAKSYGGGSYQGLDNKDADVGFQLLGHTKPHTLMPPGSANQPYADMIAAMGSDAAGTATTKIDADSTQTLSTDANDPQLMLNAFLGLIEDHVYIILPASTVQNLVLHNPHGNKHPTGSIPQANVDEVISRVDYLPVPQPQQPQIQQAQAPEQQVPPQEQPPQEQVPPQEIQQPLEQQPQVQPPPQLANAIQHAHQQVQEFNQQQEVEVEQQILEQPLNVQPQLQQQVLFIQQQIAQFQQQQFQNAHQGNQAKGGPRKKQKIN